MLKNVDSGQIFPALIDTDCCFQENETKVHMTKESLQLIEENVQEQNCQWLNTTHMARQVSRLDTLGLLSMATLKQ